MRDIRPADLASVRRQESVTDSNSTVGGYHMDECCPPGDCLYFRAVLESADTGRVYLLGDFGRFTGGTCLPAELRPHTFNPNTVARVAAFSRGSVDLRVTEDLSLVGVGWDLARGPIVLIDGNHRAIWQQLTYGSLEGVPLYVCVHPRMTDWLRARGHPAGGG